MTPTQCVSSHLMTGLLTWRNPHGPEEEWPDYPDRHKTAGNAWKRLGKVASTEIGLILLTITSVIETVAYASLAVLSLALYPVTSRPCKFFAKLIQSSSFTIFWGFSDALIYNPLFLDVETKESFARLQLNVFPRLVDITREEDISFVANFLQSWPNNFWINQQTFNSRFSTNLSTNPTETSCRATTLFRRTITRFKPAR